MMVLQFFCVVGNLSRFFNFGKNTKASVFRMLLGFCLDTKVN